VIHKSKEYNLVFLNCNDVVDYILKNLTYLDLNLDLLPKKDLKKLTLHYFLMFIFKLSKDKEHKEKPVYYLTLDMFKGIDNKNFIESIIFTFKKLKSLLPVPLIILNDYNILKSKNGEYKGVCEKLVNFYINRKIETKKLKKYLETEEYYELIKVFKDIINIKTILI